MLSRVLFSLGGLAAGILAALAIAAVDNKPGRVLQETQAELARVRSQAAELETQLGNAQADLAENEALREQMTEVLEETRDKLAEIAQRQHAKNYTRLGDLETFLVQTTVHGLDDELSKAVAEGVAARVKRLGLPVTSDVRTQTDGGLVYEVRFTSGRFHVAGSVLIVVPGQDPEGNAVSLYTESTVFESEADRLAKDLLLAVDNLTLEFKKRWEEAKQNL